MRGDLAHTFLEAGERQRHRTGDMPRGELGRRPKIDYVKRLTPLQQPRDVVGGNERDGRRAHAVTGDRRGGGDEHERERGPRRARHQRNLALHVLLTVIVTMLSAQSASPVQPAKTEPGAGFTKSWTCVPTG